MDRAEVAADEGEEITGLWVRIFPDRVMKPVGEVAFLDPVAVRQQYRRLAAVRDDAHPIGRHYVRTIEEIADAAEAIRLALRAIDAARR